MHENQDHVYSAKAVSVEARKADHLVNLSEVSQSLRHQDAQINRESQYEHQEVLVVSVAKAIVDEGAVMVEKFDTSVANGAMERGLGLDHFAVGAKVVQVEPDVERNLHNLCEVVEGPDVARLEEDCKQKEWD